MTLRLRWQTSWTSWRLKRTARKLARAEQTVLLLLLTLDSSNLRVKELEERAEQLAHRQQEMSESRAFREQQILPPAPASPAVIELLASDPSTPPR